MIAGTPTVAPTTRGRGRERRRECRFSSRGDSRETSNPVKGLSKGGGVCGASSVTTFDHAVVIIRKQGGGGIAVTDLRSLEKGRSCTHDLAQSLALGLVEPRPD